MEFYFNDYIYSQRTENSKIVCSDLDGNIIEKYTMDTLPYEVYEEYFNYIRQIEHPESFFTYEKGKTIKILEFPSNTHNLIIPAEIEGVPVTDISYEFNDFKDVNYIEIKGKFRRFPAPIFRKCKNIKKIILRDECDVDKGAFANNENLIEVVLPKNVTKIPSACFFNCKNLKSINLENIEEFESSCFESCNMLDISIPEITKQIGQKAFFKSGLTQLTIPKSVKKVEVGAFAMCENLKNYTILCDKNNISPNAFA